LSPVTESRVDGGQQAGIRTALIAGPVIACIGIAWTAMSPSTMSSAAVLVGLITSIWGTHRFGRLGAEGEGTLLPIATETATETETATKTATKPKVSVSDDP